jgi:hypothetical protein
MQIDLQTCLSMNKAKKHRQYFRKKRFNNRNSDITYCSKKVPRIKCLSLALLYSFIKISFESR